MSRGPPSPNPSPSLPAPRISPAITLTKPPFHTFHLMDCPASTGVAGKLYLPALRDLNISHLVRISSTYDPSCFKEAGITVYDYPTFPDGSVPPEPSIWHTFLLSIPPSSVIAIHCVSGIGRAPVMVAEALLHFGMYHEAADAIQQVRKVRRGAMNKGQIAWLFEKCRKSRRETTWWKRVFRRMKLI